MNPERPQPAERQARVKELEAERDEARFDHQLVLGERDMAIASAVQQAQAENTQLREALREIAGSIERNEGRKRRDFVEIALAALSDSQGNK